MIHTQEKKGQLHEAFELAQKEALKRQEMVKAPSDSWQKSETKFDSNIHDVQLQYDYNKNPDLITKEQENQLRFIMQIVQQQGTNKLIDSGKDLTKNSDIWIEFFARYPLLFNFQERKSKTFTENNFSLSADAKLLEACLDASAPLDIKNAFIQALKDSGGEVISTTTKKQNLEYLALIRSYDKASTLTIYKAQLNMQVSEVKTICGGAKNVTLNISYDRIVFEINNQLAIAIYPELSKEAADIAVKYLTTFFKDFATKEFQKFENWLNTLGK